MAEPTSRSIPTLRIFDLAKAKEFYVDFLGFRIDWEHRFENGRAVYLQIARGDLSCTSASTTATASRRSVYVCAHDRPRGLSPRDHGPRITVRARPGIEPTPWRSRLMEVIDPFGNRLRSTSIRRRRRAMADRRQAAERRAAPIDEPGR